MFNLANKSVANFEHFETIDDLPVYGSLTVTGSIIMCREVGWAGGEGRGEMRELGKGSEG